MFQLFLHQETHCRFLHKFCDARRRSMRAMRGAKGVVHIKIAESRERLREFWIVRFLFRLEADVLEQSDIAILPMSDDFFRHLANRLLAKNDWLMDERVQIIADWTEGIFVHALSFRPAKMR